MSFTWSKTVFTFVFILALAWGLGFVYFVSSLSNGQAKDETSKTDAIVVLTGVPNRITVGCSLLVEDLSEHLLISGVSPTFTMKSLMRSKCLYGKFSSTEQDIVLAKTDLGYDAHDTIGNAVEAQKWLQGKDIHTIRLVTSDYHMPRSLLEFKAILPHIAIIPHPVHSGEFSLSLARKQFWEYNKCIFSWVRLALESWVH